LSGRGRKVLKHLAKNGKSRVLGRKASAGKSSSGRMLQIIF